MLTLKIAEMSCDHCVKTIDRAVKTVDPAATIETDLVAHIATIHSKADETLLRAAIEEAGYESEKVA